MPQPPYRPLGGVQLPDGSLLDDSQDILGGVSEVADEAARLALVGLPRGAEVFQEDNEFYYKLRDPANPDDAASWMAEPKVLLMLITQSGTNAPVAVNVQRNDIGAFSFSYIQVGDYHLTSTGNFPEGKTFGYITPVTAYAGVSMFRIDDDKLAISSANSSGVGANDIIWLPVTVRVEVYP